MANFAMQFSLSSKEVLGAPYKACYYDIIFSKLNLLRFAYVDSLQILKLKNDPIEILELDFLFFYFLTRIRSNGSKIFSFNSHMVSELGLQMFRALNQNLLQKSVNKDF